MLLAFKLCITPVLIASTTLAGRKWGPAVSGLLIGLPLTSGPISFLLALEFGIDFAQVGATGSLVGQIAIGIYCLVYALTAQRWHWFFCSIAGTVAFILPVYIANHFSWQLLPAFIALTCSIATVLTLFPRNQALARSSPPPPAWDLPGRMITATSFVIILTAVADQVGAQLSGLLAPFPIFSIVFAAFTLAQQGTNAATRLLKAIVQGTFSNGLFFLVVGLCLAPLGIGLTYLLATLAALASGALTYRLTRGKKQAIAPKPAQKKDTD